MDHFIRIIVDPPALCVRLLGVKTLSRWRYRRYAFAISPLVFTLFQLSLPTTAWAAPIPGVKVKSGVTYATDGGKPQLLDVYSPSKPGTNMRAVIFVHGGGWTGGS